MKPRIPLLGSLLLIPSLMIAQASPNVSPSDPAYDDVARLVAHDLVDTVIVGQRPYSRLAVARITAAAGRRILLLQQERAGSTAGEEEMASQPVALDGVQPVLDRLRRRFGAELDGLERADGTGTTSSLTGLDRVDLEVSWADSPWRRFSGGIDGDLNPLLQYREGRRYVDGMTWAVESQHHAQVGRAIALQFRPRVQKTFPRDGQSEIDGITVQALNGKLVLGNLEVEIGRDHVVWGQGREAGALLSTNPRGHDMVRLSNDQPMRLPWWFRGLGPAKLSVFLSRMGEDMAYPGSLLAGYKLSVQPARTVETGVALLTEFAGEGSPDVPWWEMAADFIPLIDVLVIGNRDIATSNKMVAIDGRWRVPSAGGLELYGEAALDDFDVRRLASMVTDNAAYVLGARLPRLRARGDLRPGVEFHFTGLTVYRHSQYTDGLTLDRFALGDNLGPDGTATYVTVDWDAGPGHTVTFETAFERRRNDPYTATPEPHFRYVRLERLPREDRYRFALSWQARHLGLPVALQARVAYERVANFELVGGQDRNDVLARLIFSQVF